LARLNSSVMQTIQPVPSIGLNTDLFTIIILDCCAPRQSTYNHNTYKQSNPFHCVPPTITEADYRVCSKTFRVEYESQNSPRTNSHWVEGSTAHPSNLI
ncbi:hypothetical protein CWN17_32160, partial [Klebsiella pneumoniae]